LKGSTGENSCGSSQRARFCGRARPRLGAWGIRADRAKRTCDDRFFVGHGLTDIRLTVWHELTDIRFIVDNQPDGIGFRYRPD
jgi:hypothetical protein